jgi:hypothetical protein
VSTGQNGGRGGLRGGIGAVENTKSRILSGNRTIIRSFRSVLRLRVNADVPSSPILVTLMETMDFPKRQLLQESRGVTYQFLCGLPHAPVPVRRFATNVLPFKSAVGTTRPPSVVYWSEFLAADPEAPGSIPGAARFSE